MVVGSWAQGVLCDNFGLCCGDAVISSSSSSAGADGSVLFGEGSVSPVDIHRYDG